MANHVIDKNKKVRQSNEFVESPYMVEFSLHEIKVMEYLIAECKEDDYKLIGKKQGKDYNFSATQISKILNTSLSRVVTDADKLANDITKKRIEHKVLDSNGDVKEFAYLSIINEASYNNGNFYFELNYKALPFFVKVNQNFTEFQLRHLLSMKTAYAVKLYKILYQYKKIGKRTFTLDELKTQFGIKDKYDLYKHFKSRILDKSVQQINEITDIQVAYNEYKIGKKVESLEFIIKSKHKIIEIADNLDESNDDGIEDKSRAITSENLDIIIQNIKSKITSKTHQLLIDYNASHGLLYVENSIKYAKKHAKTNFDKYLKDTLSNNWAEAMVAEAEQKHKRNDLFTQAEARVESDRNDKHKKIKQTALDEYNKLSAKEQTKLAAELIQKVTSICPDKLEEIMRHQNDYVISYWACKNDHTYNGAFQLKLEVYKLI